MPIVTEVADGIKLVAEGIQNIKTIHEAIRDGRKYLEAAHPDVKQDVAAMCIEMRKTLQAVAAASAIITHFRFNISSQAIDQEPSRFNDYLMHYKTQAMEVEDQLDSLRGHCHTIRDHANTLEECAQRRGLANLFELFGLKSAEREARLSDGLRQIYDEEMQFHSNVWNMRMILERALDDIGQRLGPPGTMQASNIPAAASALGEYAEYFSKLESEANYAALQLERLVNQMSP